ncbi:tetratricopeptide repeat protein [Candidatus Sumerlaeota bacterium]|nr:tetratricopeptide repeat protein [Candidatus Sumerlaeota bacterium]
MRAKQKKSGESHRSINEPKEKADSSDSQLTLSKRRKWLFRLAAMILPSLLLFAMLEVGLRLGGFGYPTQFIVGPDSHGVFMTNRFFGWRFFPHAIAREPVYHELTAKPDGAIRIFVLGGSAAQGIPEPSFSFGEILAVMLRERHPDTQFEVVNAAMTAINSHVVREIARDCVEYQPDFYVVYMGNNEVTGPYGPGTVFQRSMMNLSFIRASIWLKSTRIAQLLHPVVSMFHAGEAPTTWEGLHMFVHNPVASDDPRLEAVYRNFHRNLSDICRIARIAGANIIFSTVAVNQRDYPPTFSQHRADLSDDELSQWELHQQKGVESQAKEDWAMAIEQYQAAIRIDDRYAETQFRLGQCMEAAGRFAEARDCFSLARDLDALRFRADSRINAVIRDAVDENASDKLRLADAEQALQSNALAPHGIPGRELFYEHVHLTFNGNYLVAQAVLEQIEAVLPKNVLAGKTQALPSRRQCAQALVLTPWDEYMMISKISELMSLPPFTDQLDHAARQDAMRNKMKQLYRQATMPQMIEAVRKSYEAAIHDSPRDYNLRYRFANLASNFGHPEVAAKHFQFLAEMRPYSFEIHNRLASVLDLCGKTEEAHEQYRIMQDLEPLNPGLHNNYGVFLARHGQLDEGVVHLRKALQLNPDYMEAYVNLGITLDKLDQPEEAIVQFKKALELNPENASIHNKLGEILARQDRAEEAVSHFEQALEREPQNALFKKNLSDVRASSVSGETARQQPSK